jgi:hypothetical protein
MFITLFSFLSCTSEKDKITQDFISHVRSLNVEKIKNMSTEDTKFYIKMSIEPIVSLGDEASIKQLKQIASTLECSENSDTCRCSYLDTNRKKQFFEIEFVTGYDKEGEKKLFIDIDKKYFLGN